MATDRKKWPEETPLQYWQRKRVEMDETVERLEWEAQVAIDNLRKYRREMEGVVLKVEGKS